MNTLIATSAVAALGIAAGANAAFVTANSFSSGAGSLLSLATNETAALEGALGYLSGSGASVSAGTWGYSMSVASSTSSLSLSGSNVLVAAASPSAQDLTFTFPAGTTSQTSSGFPYPGVFPIRGFGFYWTNPNAAQIVVSILVNGSTPVTSVVLGASTSGFFGIAQDNVAGDSITSIRLTLGANDAISITGSGWAIIPAPGAMALVAAAGLVTTRRRR